jgi:hypothetical protein
MNSQANTPFYLDKSLWIAVLTVLFVALNKRFGLSLDATEITMIVLPVVAYIVGNKWKSASIVKAEISATATEAGAKASTDATAAAAAINSGKPQ